jgi:sigma-B regulation protein RsbU (phosphoserine phosphatase)
MQTDKKLNLALLDYKSGKLLLSGQIRRLIVVRQGGEIELLDTPDSSAQPNPDDNLANFAVAASVQLQPGDGVVLYTQGIINAESTEGELYGLERLCGLVSRHWEQPAEAIKQAVVDDVHGHIDPQKMHNDLTLIVVKQK